MERTRRLYTVSALTGAFFCLALLSLRAASMISFAEPFQGHGTGDEFTNYFNIWKVIHGQVVYNDRFQPPFSAAVYNWLFYHSYAWLSSGFMRLFSLDDMWLPTATHFITLAGSLFAAVFAYLALARAAQVRDGQDRALVFAFAVFLMFGPLFGFWTLTARADIWALAFEIAGSAFFLVLYPRRRFSATLIFMFFVYIAWSFKQGNIFSVGGAGLLLLARRDWNPLLLMAVGLPAAWAVTFMVGVPGEPLWAHDIMFKDFQLYYSVERMFRNIVNFAVKSGPTLFLLSALAAIAIRSRRRLTQLWSDHNFVFAAGASLGALMSSIPASAQLAGSENYFFPLSFFLALMAMTGMPLLRTETARGRNFVFLSGAAGWGTICLAILLVLTGAVGVIDLTPQHRHYMAWKRCADTLPRPLFFNNPYMGLPWMTPGNTPWVLSFVYHDERAQGRMFQNGGIGGMIAQGDFAAVAAVEEGSAPSHMDGGSLALYEATRSKACPGMYIFLRKP